MATNIGDMVDSDGRHSSQSMNHCCFLQDQIKARMRYVTDMSHGCARVHVDSHGRQCRMSDRSPGCQIHSQFGFVFWVHDFGLQSIMRFTNPGRH